MEFIRNFSQLNKKNADIAGGKGASLGEMLNAGIPVPPGFVVLSKSFEQFIRETDLVQEIDAILHKVDHKEIHTVESASEKIRELILNAEMPKDIADEISGSFTELNTKYVAVRSSATAEDGKDHAWAGQLESYLNTTEDDVLTKVKLCWSSLFTPRAIFYRFEKGLHSTKISVAVVVQKMVESEVSGIAFSVHPVTEDRNQLIIEAGFGLGEAIVSGSVTPDSYVVEKKPRNILDINVSTQNRGLYRSDTTSVEHGNNEWINIPEPKASSQVLTKEQILELSEIIIGIEKHYGFPCDIEWAFEKGKFYIVQSRPITTLTKTPDDSSKYPLDIITDIKSYKMYWSAQVSPLMASLLGECYCTYIDDKFGVGFHKVLFFSNGSKTSSYFRDIDRRKFAEYVIARFAKNKESIQEFCQTIKGKADKFNEFLLKNEGNSSVDTYFEFKKLLLEYNFFHITPRHLADYLDPLRAQEFLEDLKDVRIYTEKLHYALEQFLQSLLLKIFDNRVVGNPCLHSCVCIETALNSNMIVNEVKYIEPYDFVLLAEKNKIRELDKITRYQIYSALNMHESVSELTGNVAFQGIAKGIVRIVIDPSKAASFNEGDILVAEMTRPEYVPYMNKAAAVVTDGGGTLCHAAIIARELKKPCIIGTGNATKVLHDGDIVEVDANKGLVRILEKAKK